jgi:hypothetical protein
MSQPKMQNGSHPISFASETRIANKFGILQGLMHSKSAREWSVELHLS